jgi:hypothetical protein
MRLNIVNIYIVLSLVTLLTACDNNSNSDSNNNNTNTNTNYPVDDIVQLDEIQSINQGIDLLLYYPYDSVSNINWQQTAGEPVTILAKTSKVISFTPTLAGDYNFSVTFTLNNELEQTLEKSISVNGDSHKITNRLSHTALAESKVSFRSELHQSIAEETVLWQQVSGPSVTLTSENTDGELAIFFDAPNVSLDSIIVFSVTAVNTDNTTTYSDLVAVLIEPAPAIGNKAYFSDRTASVFPYNRNSAYADDLVNCVYSNTLISSCTLAQTPLLAEEVKSSSNTPSIESIMDRVVVSHQWMGDRFKDFLTNNDTDNDIKNLLRATTAIVISYDVRPSFYWPATGAIYLDAENFWLTPQERDTINEAPDYRANFGNDLHFVMPWRYVKDNDYASFSYSKSSRVTRIASEGLYRLTSLMYHELAHANDFFPSNEWYSHNNNKRVYDAAVSTIFESDELAISSPLKSQEMRNLGQVSFAGEAATSLQKSYLPIDIEGFFSPDRASDFYAYSSLREDYAMLFEELMMQNRFAVIRDVAITNQPMGENTSAADYIVTWGQRGRIGDNKLRDRVLFSASRVLPEFNSQAAINLVPVPIEMIEGDSWLDNLTISPSEVSINSLHKQRKIYDNGESDTRSSSISTETEPVNKLSRYYQKPLPDH